MDCFPLLLWSYTPLTLLLLLLLDLMLTAAHCCFVDDFPALRSPQLVQVHSQKSKLPGGFIVSLEALISQHGWDLAEYFRGMSSKLLMTVLSMALVFAGKETLLRWTVRLRQALPKMLAVSSNVKFRKHARA